jgi:hypothetical protein
MLGVVWESLARHIAFRQSDVGNVHRWDGRLA